MGPLAMRRLGEPLARVRALWRFDRGRVAQPSPVAKRRQLLELFRQRDHAVFIESGTYLGGTVAFFAPHARQIVSVEIDPRLYERARRRFASQPHVDLRLGDATEVVPAVVGQLRDSSLVWLDGHFSGGATGSGRLSEPAIAILDGLSAVDHSDMTVVVDDLRRFGRASDVPTLGELVDAARRAFPGGQIMTGLDCLIIQA